MDVGEYDTNTLLLNNIAFISFRIYEPLASQSAANTFDVSDVEISLRSDGHIVYADSLRRGIWCFHLVGKDGSVIGAPSVGGLGATLDIRGQRLGLIEDGRFEPMGLLKSRGLGTNHIHTPNGSSPSGSSLDMALRNAQSFSLPGSQGPGSGALDLDAKTHAGALSETKGYGAIPVKDVYEYFIGAVLSTLSSAFCSKTGAIALNSRSILLPTTASPSKQFRSTRKPLEATLATLRVYLTTTGTLLMSVCHSLLNGMTPIAPIMYPNLLPPGSTVLAAPLGVFATLQGLVDGDYHLIDSAQVQSPETQVSRVRAEAEDRLVSYRAACARLLEMRGISSSILQDTSWLSIQCLRRRPVEPRIDGKRTPVASTSATIVWPAALCFWKTDSTTEMSHRRATSPNHNHDYDPLSNAKTWFDGTEDREETLSIRCKERETSAAQDVLESDGRSHTANGYSPLALRAGNNGNTATVAAGAMYPTPPDGVQNPVGATPSFDGVVSSPGNPNSTSALVDVDTAMANTGENGDAFVDSWDGGEAKPERQGSSFTAEPETLFDDMGADIFADNDITDADFSFFDEQPGGAELDFTSAAGILASLDDEPAAELDLLQSRNPAETSASRINQSTVSPVFAKPELKHARSSLGEEARQTPGDKRAASNLYPLGTKRSSSPFDEMTVYKRVRASLTPTTASVSSVTQHQPRRRSSIFESVEFNPFLSLNNEKYQENGRFNYNPTMQKADTTSEAMRTPTTSCFGRHGRDRTGLKILPSNVGALIANITGSLENSSLHRGGIKGDDVYSDADDNSLISDEDDSSDGFDAPSPPAKGVTTRRGLEDDAISLAASLKDVDGAAVSSPLASTDLSKLPNKDLAEVSLERYFADPESVPFQSSLVDEDLMLVAQILTEQAVSGCLQLPSQDQSIRFLDQQRLRRGLAEQSRTTVETMRSILPAALSGTVSCQFKPFIEVQDVPLLGQPSRLQPRPPAGTEQLRPGNLYQIAAPHFELRRYESKLSVASSAVNFWEVLGLGPAAGPKDIKSVCVYPNYGGMSGCINAFLNSAKIQYEALKLGIHDRLANAAGISDGHLPLDIDKATDTPSSSAASRLGSPALESMSKLAQALAAQAVSEKNFVIYFVYSRESGLAITDACVAFHRLFELYKNARSSRSPVLNELVLQLVSLDLLSSTSTIALPSPSRLVKFCLETYDRCTLFGGAMPAPAIVLEKPLPRGIDFKLTTTPSANLFQENSCIHIAYAQSIDERWVTAAWTDNRGTKQMTASYCLGRRGKAPSTPLADVAREIWDTTHDLISMWKVHWRIIITKCGPMDQEEMDLWTDLGKSETKASVNLTLLTVDTNPSLQLIPPPAKIPVATPSLFYSTPVSTPQASIVSPEQSGNNAPTPMGANGSVGATTPGGENIATEPDSDTTLIDITDTTWGALASHRLSSSTTLTELNPALASGYLVKRGGPRGEDPPAMMEVNVMHSEGNPRLYDALLREMLTYFRGLGTIARARGIVDGEADVRPWHVAAAEKGARALYLLM